MTLASDPATTCPQNYIDFGNQLCDTAADLVLQYFRGEVAIDEKSDASPVTLADRRAEALMRQKIREHCPTHGILGEEYGSERQEADFLWVLDPIDGTRSFISKHAVFGTLVSLLYKGQAILGIISMPALGERWVGARGHPTVFHSRKGRSNVVCRPYKGLSLTTMGTTAPHLFPAGFAMDAYQALSQNVKFTLYGGDCYNYGLVASGGIDFVLEDALGLYDYMALVPVVEGAGGRVCTWQGESISLASRGDIIAASSKELAAEILQKIAEIRAQGRLGV